MYSIKSKKRFVINAIFDKIYTNDKMTWANQSISFNFSIFVVWREISNDVKNRVVVDIRELNKVIESNTYFISLQFDIINTIVEFLYILIVDTINWFYQFNVKMSNRFKFIVVSYKKQKQFNVILMNFKKSSFYVQRQTNQMLRFYQKFSRVYMNNIIIFFKTFKKYMKHLRQIFRLFQQKRVSLIFIKSFLNYLFIILLNQRVDNLKLSTFEKKMIIITFLQFSTLLRDLKYFLDLIDWLRHCIDNYAQLTQFFQARKTIFTKTLSIDKTFDSIRKKYSSRLTLKNSNNEKCQIFYKLQNVFVNSIFLVYFDSNRRFYVDLKISKRWDFVVMIYHVVKNSNDNVYSRFSMQSIFFLASY